MSDDEELLMQFGGLQRNSLNYLLNSHNDKHDLNNIELETIKHSSYYGDQKLSNELISNPNYFNILSLNCESLNAKFDQLQIKILHLLRNGCNFSVICLQETWLSNDSDTSLFAIEGFNIISQGKMCTTRGGLIIYIKDTLKYNRLNIYINSNICKGQFIEIYCHSKQILIGNLYRPPLDINENYMQFINEFTPILDKLSKLKSEVSIAGDFNIDLLKIYDKPVFSESFDLIIALGFFPKITLPTRFSDRRGTLINNFLYKW